MLTGPLTLLGGPVRRRLAKEAVEAATEQGLCPKGAGGQNLLTLLLEECDRIGRVEGWSIGELAVECRVTRQTIVKALKTFGEGPPYVVMTRTRKVRSRQVPEYRVDLYALESVLLYQRGLKLQERSDRRSVKAIHGGTA
jgi:hypothetical protein